MSRGKKGFFSGLALLGLSAIFLLGGPAVAQLAISEEPAAGEDNLAPAPVASVVAELLSESSVIVNWDLSPDDLLHQVPVGGDPTSGGVFVNANDVAGYRVWRSEGGDPEVLATLAAGDSSYVDESVESGATYVYLVTAVDAAGNESGAVEDTVTIGPLAPARIDLSGTRFNFAQVLIGTSRTYKLKITNRGEASLMGTLALEGGGGYLLSKTSFLVRGGQKDSVNVSFAPTETGESAGAIVISSSDPDRPELRVTLWGVGVEEFIMLLPGDFDLNSKVDLDDFFLIADQFGTTTADSNWYALVDLDGDGDVDLEDIALFADYYEQFYLGS